MTTKNF